MSAAEIVLSKETANDETALIVAVYVAGGSEVTEDQLLFDAESSKATQEIRAPMAGIVLHDLVVGQEIGFGVPLGVIAPLPCAGADAASRSEAAPPVNGSEAEPEAGRRDQPSVAPPRAVPVPPPVDVQDNRPLAAAALRPTQAGPGHGLPAPRFSKAAAALIAQYDLSPASFGLPFVTAAEVRQRIGAPRATPSAPADAPGEPVSARKRAEIDVLGGGAGGSLLSVVGVSLGRLAIRRPAGSFLANRIVDLVIFEAARLMKRYPKLNAAYRDGRLVLHPAVHAGLAIDGGGRLVVYGIADADTTALADLPEIMADAVARYVEEGLTAAEMTRATFTVTDLSDGDLDFVLPLLPRGQSCILGITRDADGAFRLFAGFDHRVTEGREVSSFLGELRTRLLSFSAAEPDGGSAHCLYCERSAEEAVGLAKDRGLLRIVDRRGREALCCASCWNGW